jgi:uncharacterized protein YqgC (DUF456 family)
MGLLVLALILVASLVMIPLGLPGLWVMLAAALGYQLLVPGSISWVTTIGCLALALVAEFLEFTLSARYTRKYGGSRRASWGAIVGGIVGAFVGVPVPIVGSIVGAFIGSFVGALAAELSRGSTRGQATRVAWGALVGRAVAAAMKMGFGVAIAAWVLWAAII